MELTKEKIKEKALELGFSSCGFAEAGVLETENAFFHNYLQEKRNAAMHYLERNPEKRLDPRLVFEGTRTVIGLLLNYFPSEALPEKDNFIISKDAYGRDYHIVVKERANALISFMKETDANVNAKAYVDSGPVLEKAWARMCGIGWTGKNTLVINPSRGSFHFIAIILTDLLLEPDAPETDHCGNCTRCMDACPTGALEKPFVLNPSLCIAYLTIELKEGIPENLEGKLNGRVYGCDACQDVCPYNRFAIPHELPELLPSETLKSFRKDDWLNLTEDQFNLMFKESSIRRIGYKKLMNNIRSASGSTEIN
ncbi:MAG: tRNA epoxyqueuosine(34) reductase QueG [Bacteroidetes bacterium]|nr:tRNA epoxyqueuosine(34) reductase QueG [Bacteroidota bacterium]